MPPKHRNQHPKPSANALPLAAPCQQPLPPAAPDCPRLDLEKAEIYLRYPNLSLIPTFDSLENRMIVDAIRNRGIAPATAIANAAASAIAKGNVQGPSGQSSGISAALSAVKAPPSLPSSRAPSPTPSVLSTKRPHLPGSFSSSSGPPLAAYSVCGEEPSSMVLEYESVTPRPGSPAEPTDATNVVQHLISTIEDAFVTISEFASNNYEANLLKEFPHLMDDDIKRLCEYFLAMVKGVSPLLLPLISSAVAAPAPAVEAPATHVISRNAQPWDDKSHPKKKVQIDPAPPTPSTSSALATALAPVVSDVPTGAHPPSASRKVPAKPFPIPSSKRAPPPKSAPPISVSTVSMPRKRRSGKYTTHGTSRHGIVIQPPANVEFNVAKFTPEILGKFNSKLEKDLKSDLILTHAIDGDGIYIAASHVPTQPEINFVLKHIKSTWPIPDTKQKQITSTSYMKIVDIPHIAASPAEWHKTQEVAFVKALRSSPIRSKLICELKHKARFMRTSPHADSCVAWIDLHDTTTGSMAKQFVNKVINIGGVNCHIQGTRPHSGSICCERCQRWGHHQLQCRARTARCALCGGPHFVANHILCVKPEQVLARHCVNCTASGHPTDKRSHSSSDTGCPFWKNRFDRDWLKRQFKPREDNSKPGRRDSKHSDQGAKPSPFGNSASSVYGQEDGAPSGSRSRSGGRDGDRMEGQEQGS